ncbi:MAG: divalent-cation tolerance protein CutA [Acidobacteriota bacterium]|nr:divalent-cation tolerance protein CutA [Acidobacteriota bacterium]
MTEALVVITTTETKEDAERLAHLLVEHELAACVQMLPQITSVYRWQGRVEQAGEALLLIKTNRQTYPRLESAIKQNHKYQTPEIIALPVAAGADDYLRWLSASLNTERITP